MSRAASTLFERSEPLTFARVGSILLLDGSFSIWGFLRAISSRGLWAWRPAGGPRRGGRGEKRWRGGVRKDGKEAKRLETDRSRRWAGGQPWFANARSRGFPPGWGLTGTDHRDSNKPRVTFRAEIAGEVGEHAVQQFVGVRRLGLGFVGRLAERRAGMVELVAAGTVIQPVDPRAVRALLRYVAQQAQDEVLRVEGERRVRVPLW